MTRVIAGLLRGAAAGAAGTTALNVTGYLDMVYRARPASHTPEATVEALSQAVHVTVPGDAAQKENRIAALGALSGIAAGLGMGALLGAARSLGWRPAPAVIYAVATIGAMIGTNGLMTVLRVTDPRAWSRTDWIADLVPHLAYAGVTTAVVTGLDP
ncbi:hypothetical protein [Actinacidiphila oryziradicis]|uniref:DUF1761 domain-containing protein n=1 Tax=Actinacidiphila oryziradicis TaxID=2571141 RepID=A0A4U0RFX7_9ACTN|nr:hypothetical protein [Actinacidiphila oryziradicis]TJZ93622.1 hypothetical protein FCI23_54305 [Actinacidiphila oryziradicis]